MKKAGSWNVKRTGEGRKDKGKKTKHTGRYEGKTAHRLVSTGRFSLANLTRRMQWEGKMGPD